MEIELFTREAVHEWTSVIFNEPVDTVRLNTLNCTLTLSEIYDKIVFGE